MHCKWSNNSKQRMGMPPPSKVLGTLAENFVDLRYESPVLIIDGAKLLLH